MKTKLIIIMLFFLAFCLSQAQKSVWLCTPNNTQVQVTVESEMSNSEIDKWNRYFKEEYPNAEYAGTATKTYNCHNFAWNNSAPDQYWMEDPQAYWVDGSYLSDSANFDKIFYPEYNISGTHSAKTHSNGKYISKWGPGPLMIHDPNYGPYDNMDVRVYYKRNSVNNCITGLSTTICENPVTYSLMFNQATSWSVSSGFTVIGYTGSSATVAATVFSGQQGTLTAHMSCGNNLTLSIEACTTYITGPSNICMSLPQNFSTNAQTGFTWDKSSNLSISGTGNTVSVSATSTGAAWIRVMANGKILAHQDLWAGLAVVTEITGSEYVGSSASYQAYVLSDYIVKPNCQWINISGTAMDIQLDMYAGVYSTAVNVTFYEEGYHTLGVIPSNACGTNYSGLVTKTVYSTGPKSPFKVYPNPVSDILNIEITQQAIDRAKAASGNPTGAIEPVFDIRLYDGQGNQLRQTTAKSGNVTFNVSSLPDGIYYLHIYDGISDKPEILKVIVKH